jgi:hypothetical protein
MAFHVFLFLLVVCLLLSLALLWRLDWLHLQRYHSKGQRLSAHFGHWLEMGRRGRKALRWQVAANLIYGQVKKSNIPLVYNPQDSLVPVCFVE